MPKSNRKIINIVIDDYAIRMVNHAGGNLRNVTSLNEKAIPSGLIKHGRILDEIEFFNFMKETVREWGIKRRSVQFYVPDSLVIMKKVTFPANLKEDQIKRHLNLELGHTLYLPFDNPIFDVFPLPYEEPMETKETSGEPVREGLLFAVPQEEVQKYTEIFADSGLRPIAADVRSIGIYRYFNYMRPSFTGDAYLFIEINLSSVLISIFSQNIPEFMRYIDLDFQHKDWQSTKNENGTIQWSYSGNKEELNHLIEEQLVELERIMNFYRYSIHKGEKSVSEIILLGDFPNMNMIFEKMQSQLSIPVELFNAYLSPRKSLEVSRSFIPAIGLSLKEVAAK